MNTIFSHDHKRVFQPFSRDRWINVLLLGQATAITVHANVKTQLRNLINFINRSNSVVSKFIC